MTARPAACVLALASVMAAPVSAPAQERPSPASPSAVEAAVDAQALRGTTTRGTEAAAPPVPSGIDPPPGYVIGIQDTFDVVVWKDEEMSAENVVVRPDGKISLPLVNDIDAVGLTVEQLRAAISRKAEEFVQAPTVSVVVKEINSLRVSILGQGVAKPGQYPLLRTTTIVELISMAGGVAEYADTKNIRVTRVEHGTTTSHKFNLKDFQKGKPQALAQNIELKPGDIVTVP